MTLSCLASNHGWSQTLPTGGSVASGNVTIGKPSGNGAGGAGNTLNITQNSQNAIVNWQSFSIGANSTVNIAQPDSSAAMLDRVTGTTSSSIAGRLNANGEVFLINPNGIAITKSGVVNVGGGFVASTLGISDDDFKNGTLSFKGNGASAAVTNQGAITVGRGGYAALLGGSVNNAGLIAVPLGKVGLGAGEAATLDVSGDGFLQVAVPTVSAAGSATQGGGPGSALIQSSGTIAANGGTVIMSAATARAAARSAINLSGLVEAHSISGHDGAIDLSAGTGGGVQVSGTLDVSGGGGNAAVGAAGGGAHSAGVASGGATGNSPVRAVGTMNAPGGSVTITGQDIALVGASIDASGGVGGSVRIGGDEHGGGTLPIAGTLSVDAGTLITADALGTNAGAHVAGSGNTSIGGGTGQGGSVVLWSDEDTSFAGKISATGAAGGGNGGDVEVSSRNLLQYSGSVDLKAAHGEFGTLLLDPYNITIETAGGETNGTLTATSFTPTGSNSILSVTDLQNALANASVVVSTGGAGSPGSDAGNITVANALTWSSGSTLTLSAYHSIAIDAGITITGAGGLTLTTNNGGSGGTLTFAQGASAQFTGTYSNANDGGNTALDGTALGTLNINGAAYTLLNSMMQIDGIDSTAASTAGYTHLGSGLAGRYALADSLAAAGTSYTDALVGTDSSGSTTTQFTGTFEGLGNTISGLSITKTTNSGNYVGLFGYIGTGGTVRDIGIVGGSISGYSEVGGLAGANSGTVANSYASDVVYGSVGGSNVGGLIGTNGPTGAGTLMNSYATGSVLGGYGVGGLVGENGCDSPCTGSAIVTEAYATGAVGGSSVGVSNIGGLIGRNGGTGGTNVIYTYSTGAVANGGYPGGSMGYAYQPMDTYFDTTNSGQANGRSNASNSTTGVSGITALTTAQLQGTAALPNGITVTLTGFSGGVAGTTNGGTTGEYPYLSSFFPNGVQTISGTAYKGFSTLAPLVPVTLASSPVTVTVGGAVVGTVSTGATGYYYLALPPTTISGSGSNVLAYTTANSTTGAANGDNFTSATGSLSGLNIYGGASGINTTSSLLYSTMGTFSSTNSGPVYTAIVGYSSTPNFVATLPPLIVATGASFTFDEPLDLTSSLYLTTSAANAPITIAAPITLEGANALSLSAAGALAVNANITVPSTGTVNLSYNTAVATNFTFAQGASLQFTGTYSGANDGGNTALDGTALGTLNINGAAYTLLNSMMQIDGIDSTAASTAGYTHLGSGLAGRYALADSLAAAGTSYTDALVGTDSSGSTTTQFTGTFEGLGNTISGLSITKTTNSGNYAGLFGYVGTGGTVRDIGIVGGSISGGGSVGGLVGSNAGTVANSYAGDAVDGSGTFVGGLVGQNGPAGAGTLIDVYATGSVIGNNSVGGLVGKNGCDSSCTGNAVITEAFATGAVGATGTSPASFGGLIGRNGTSGSGYVTYTYSTGAVTSSSTAGGSLGYSNTVSDDYWDTATSGKSSGASNVANGTTGVSGTTPLTTGQLQGTAALPNGVTVTLTGFSGGVAGTTNGGTSGEYPYLTSFFPNGVQAVAGFAYQNTGTGSPLASTAAGVGAVSIASAGAVAGVAATGANGYYYMFMPAGTLGTNSNVVAFTQSNGATGAQNAATFAPLAGLSGVTALNVYGGWRLDQTGAAYSTLSGLNSAYATAIGSTAPAAFTLANREIDLSGAFGIDQSLDVSGTLALSAGGAVSETGGATLTAGSLVLTGSGASYALGNGNSIGTLAAATGGVSLNDTASLATGTVSGAAGAGTAGVTTSGTVSLVSSGDITIASGDTVSGESPVIAAAGAFVNDAGAGALTATSGRWLIYSSSPGADTFDSLNSNNTAVFNATYSSLPPGSVTQGGNTYLFANQPSLTVTSVSDTKSYGVDDSASLASDYTVTGASGYAAFSTNTTTSGAPLVTSSGSTAYATVAGGPYPINVTQGTLASAAGYAFNFVDSGSLTVTQATITVAGATGVNKNYDTTTSLPGGASGFTLSGIYAPDIGAISVSAASAVYAGPNAGAENVNVSGLTLSGAAANNYMLSATSVTGSGTIAPAPINLTGTRVYDAGLDAAAGLFSVSGLSGQTLTLTGSGTLAAKNVGTEALTSLGTLTLGNGTSGNIGAASNYTLVGGNDSVSVTSLGINVNATGISKVYDGTLNDDVTLASTGVLAGDVVSFGDTSALFGDKNVGTGKTVTVSGITVGGADGGNYTVNNSGATTTADITPKELGLNLQGQGSKVYDSTTSISLNGVAPTLTGVISGDSVSVGTGSVTGFVDKNVGTDKAVDFSGFMLSGTDAYDYMLVSGSAPSTASITPATISAVTGITAANKIYDATTAATLNTTAAGFTGIFNGDRLSVAAATGAFTNANVGSGKTVNIGGITLGGTDAGNYVLGSSTATTTADITPATISAVTGITAANKVYDTTTVATLDTNAAGFTGMFAGDQLSVATATGAFANTNVGNGKTVNISGITLGGTDAGNYVLGSTTTTTMASITPATIRVVGATGVDKVYDGTTTLPAGASGFITTGIFSSDAGGVVVSAASAAYANAAVGPEAIDVGGLTLSGSAAGNYVLSAGAVTGSGAITAASGGGTGGTGGGSGSGSSGDSSAGGSGIGGAIASALSSGDAGSDAASMVALAASHELDDSVVAMPLVYSVVDNGRAADVVDSLGNPGFDYTIVCVKGHCEVVRAAVGDRATPVKVGR